MKTYATDRDRPDRARTSGLAAHLHWVRMESRNPFLGTLLRRSVRTADTHLGKVRIKSAEFLGETREKPEYDDLRAIASAQDMTFQKAREEALGEK